MGERRQSQLRRAENEVVFRQYNDRVALQADQLLPNANKATFPIALACECSNETCMEKIELPVEQYFMLNRSSREFIIKPHHEQADIERVIEKFDGFDVVEKFEVPPSTDGKLNRTQPQS